MSQTALGVDVSKAHLDVFDPRGSRLHRFTNDAPGLAALLALRPNALVFEPTGPYSDGLEQTMQQAGVCLYRVNPRHAREFARACGQIAKTDRIDARVLSAMAASLTPPAYVPASPAVQILRELQAYRGNLVEARKACLNQLERYTLAGLVTRLRRRIAVLTRQIQEIERQIAAHVESDEALATRARMLQAEPGIGQTTATTLMALLPELGQMNRRAIASLAGLAPHAHESGKYKGKRRVWGGRARVRQALYMAALSAARHHPRLKHTYANLRAAGKPPKLALIAIARKLLTILNAKLRNPICQHSC